MLVNLKKRFAKSSLYLFVRAKRGATAIEYGLIAVLIVIGLIVAVTAVGNSSKAMYNDLDSQWDAAAGG